MGFSLPPGPQLQVSLVLDECGGVRAVSGPAAELLKRAPADLVGASVAELFAPLTGGDVMAALRSAPGDAVPMRLLADATSVRASCHELIGADGAHWICHVEPARQDVGHARLLEQVVEHSPIAKIVADETGIIRFANPQAEQLFGYTRAEMVGSPVELLVPASVKARHPELRGRYRGQPEPRAFTGLKARRRDGTLVPISLGLTPIDIDGRFHVVASAMDESDHERAENSLRAVIEHTPAVVFQLDSAGRVVVINERARRLFGYSTRDAEGRPLSAFVSGGDAAADGPSCDIGALRGGALVRDDSCECVGIARDGRRFPVNLALEPVDTPNGQVVLAAVTDLTPIIESDRMLQRARSVAEEAADVKTGFLATISHEMRTPLNSIIGLSELLDDTPLSHEQSEYVESIRMGGSMLLNLIQDVLDLAKFESGTLQLQDIIFDPRECLHETVEVVRGAADAKGLSLRCTVADDVPERVSGDPHRLRQVLVNLVNNAIKFTDRGGVRVQLARRCGEDGRIALEFKVSDTGIGIPGDRIDRLFQAFSQVDSEIQRRFGGSGLGLVICKRLVEAMDGSISVTSTERQGSTFEFYVQVRQAAGVAQERRGLPRALPQVELEPLRVLLVEDNAINQRVAQMMLARLNQTEVVTAANGREALSAARRDTFDVILMDLLMPEMDGLEASRRIRTTLARERQPHIIAMTANAMPGDRERCLAAGMDDYLSKPVRVHELTAVLSRFIASRSAAAAGQTA